MTLKDALARYKGVGPGFHLLRHVLSTLIVLFHCRQCIYWTHSAQVIAAAGRINTGMSRTSLFTAEDIVRPAIHSLVGMFFALSGFLIAGSALRTHSTKQFLSNRGLRIFPALGVETLLSAFILGPIVTVLPLAAYFSNPEFFHYFGNIIGDIHFTLPGVFEHLPLPRTINGQLWTLPSEFYCYLIMAIMMVTGIVKRRNLLLGIGFVSLAIMLGLHLFAYPAYDAKGENFFAPWYIVALFWGGVICFQHAEKVSLKLWMFVASGAAYWLIMFFNFLTPLAGIFLIYCMVYIGFTRFPWWDRLVKSDFSYGIYLYHFPIIQTFLFFLLPHISGWSLARQLMFIFPLSLISTIVFAAISWRVIEKPALSLRKVFARTKSVVDTPVAPGSDEKPSAVVVPAEA